MYEEFKENEVGGSGNNLDSLTPSLAHSLVPAVYHGHLLACDGDLAVQRAILFADDLCPARLLV